MAVVEQAAPADGPVTFIGVRHEVHAPALGVFEFDVFAAVAENAQPVSDDVGDAGILAAEGVGVAATTR